MFAENEAVPSPSKSQSESNLQTSRPISGTLNHLRDTLTIVIPVFNERECLPELERRLSDLRSSVASRIEIRVLLVDDGSTDGSRSDIFDLADRYEWIMALALTRNFGHQAALLAGLENTSSEYVAILDADLQDPPELLPKMLNKLRNEKLHVVYGQRVERLGESWFKTITAKSFYRLIRSISAIDFPIDAGDFRVIDRLALNTVLRLNEREKFFRGLFAWTGLASAPFSYVRDQRFAGKTKYGVLKMLKLALNSIVSFSMSPFRTVQLLGAVLFVTGLFLSAIWVSLIVGDRQTVLWPIAALFSLSTGLTIASIGVVGGYVYRIQDQVMKRPCYIVDQTRNLV